MRKPDRGTAQSVLVALLICAGAAALAAAPAAASRGCPQAALMRQAPPRTIAHPPARMVLACVGTTPIAGARFAHSFAIERHQLKTFSTESVRMSALADLTFAAAVEAEAREHHVVVTARAVHRSFEHLLRTRFRRRGSLQRFLRSTGERTKDFVAGVRQDLLIAALTRHETRAQLDAFDAKWQARTTCARAVADGDVCGLIAPFAAGPPAIGVPNGPGALAVDPTSDTVYVVTANGLMMIDGRTCNASMTTGCTRARTVVLAHTDPRGIALDPATHTLYVAAGETDSIAVLDTRVCNATVARCNRGTLLPLGRHVVPLQPLLDPSTHTLYVLDNGIHTISVVDAGHCNALDRGGCKQTPARLRTADDFPESIAVDPATSTLYVADETGYRVSLVDTRTCSALDASRCAARAPVLQLPGIANPSAFAIDPVAHALYVSADTDELFAFDAATCNATVRSGCAQRRTVRLRGSADAIAIDAPTHTAYLANRLLGGAGLLDVAACNPGNGGGCARRPRLARTGREPGDVAIDERTRTVYVANARAEEGSVSLIPADRCNATTTAGC